MSLGSVLGSVGGDLVGTWWSAKQAGKQATRARDWEERMANTAHQREVADLKAAGLNPILSGTGGAGAAVPNAPVAQVPDASSFGSKITSAVKASKEMALLESQRKLADATASKTMADEITSKVSAASAQFDLDQKKKWSDPEKGLSIAEGTQRLSQSAAGVKKTEQETTNLVQQLNNLKIEAHKGNLSNAEQFEKLKLIVSSDTFRDFYWSQEYGERKTIDRVINSKELTFWEKVSELGKQIGKSFTYK